eukprot:353284-Chlamydomonas_euryale.AAC.5
MGHAITLGCARGATWSRDGGGSHAGIRVIRKTGGQTDKEGGRLVERTRSRSAGRRGGGTMVEKRLCRLVRRPAGEGAPCMKKRTRPVSRQGGRGMQTGRHVDPGEAVASTVGRSVVGAQ